MTTLATCSDSARQPSARDVATPAGRAVLRRCIDRLSLLLQHALAARDGLGDAVCEPASRDTSAAIRASVIQALLAAPLPAPRLALSRPTWVRLFQARLDGAEAGLDAHRATLFFGQLERWRTTASETAWYRAIGAAHGFTSDDFAVALALDWLPREGITTLAFADALAFGNPLRRMAFLRALAPAGAVVRAGLVAPAQHPLTPLCPAPAVVPGPTTDILTTNVMGWMAPPCPPEPPTSAEPDAIAVRTALMLMRAAHLPNPLTALAQAADHIANLLAFVPVTGLGHAGLAAIGDSLEHAVALALALAPDLMPAAIANMISALPRHATNDPALRAETLSCMFLRAAAAGSQDAVELALAARDFAAAHGLRTQTALACGIAARILAPTPAESTAASRRLDVQLFHLAGSDSELGTIAAARLLAPEAVRP